MIWGEAFSVEKKMKIYSTVEKEQMRDQEMESDNSRSLTMR